MKRRRSSRTKAEGSGSEYEQGSEEEEVISEEVEELDGDEVDREIPGKTYKVRIQALNVLAHNLNKVDVRRYVGLCYTNYTEYMSEVGCSPAVMRLLNSPDSTELVKDVSSSSLTSWLGTCSPPLVLPETSVHDLTGLYDQKIRAPVDLPLTKQMPATLPKLQLPFLSAKHFSAGCSLKKPDMYVGCNLHAFGKSLGKEQHVLGVEEPAASVTSTVLNCGGPVAALAICPRLTVEGEELLAVATFSDEVSLAESAEADSSFVQFWTFNSDSLSGAKCRFLLEVPSSTALDLKFCPNVTEGDSLGLLAVATSKGVIFVFKVPSTWPETGADGLPPVFRQRPVATLIHPPLELGPTAEGAESQSSENTDSAEEPAPSVLFDQVPLFSLAWPAFGGGAKLAAVSDARRVLIWDLTQAPAQPGPSAAAPHLKDVELVYSAQHSIAEVDWESPPGSLAWPREDEVVVAFRNRTILVYKLPGNEVLLKESTPRTVGNLVETASPCMNGFVTADTVLNNVDGILYSNSCFVSLEGGAKDVVLPLLNGHQLQTFDFQICPRTGIMASCGGDGRLIQSMNGRTPLRARQPAEEEAFSFMFARPLLHLVRHRLPVPELEPAPPAPVAKGRGRKKFAAPAGPKLPVCAKRADAAAQTWLELRTGDAALADLVGVKKHRTRVPLVMLDRRLESLTRVALSPHTAGLTCAGGEAGLVFVLTTLL